MDKAKEQIKNAALDWCNIQRGARGMEQLTELPKGKKADSASCPCGKATGLSVGTYTYSDRENDILGMYLPIEVTRFVRAFDNNEFPELVE